MAKKTAAKKPEVKKPRRRLKRTARRSLAAVLMITAVVVAAIPVPENRAEETGSGGAAASSFAYKAADATTDYEENSAGKHSCGSISCSTEKLTDDGELSPNLKTAVSNKSLKAAVKLSNVEGTKMLDWEFLYHSTEGGTSAKLCKYNNRFQADETSIGVLLVKDYHTVPIAQFNAYFSDPTKYNDTKNPMNNLKVSGEGTNTTYSSLYPTKDIVYTYEQVLGTLPPDQMPISDKELKFLKEYFELEVTEFEQNCLEWQAKHDEWEKIENAYENWEEQLELIKNDTTLPDDVKAESIAEHYNKKPAEPGPEPTCQESFTRAPKDLETLEDKKKFYLEHNNLLMNYGYTLEEALDYRLQSDGSAAKGEPVFVAYGGTAPTGVEGTTYANVDGYLVERDGENRLTTIGERAFAGVRNVGKISISGSTKTIGDEAFLNSSITSIYFGNEATIGNRAFYGCASLKDVSFGDTSGAFAIGAEAFRSSGLTSVQFPKTVSVVGHGAFSDCRSLASVDLTQINGTCILKDFAFFDDIALTNVNFDGPQTDIIGMGKGCFAVTTPSTGLPLTSFTFPRGIKTKQSESSSSGEGLGDYVLANRQSLETVTMPYNYRSKIPDNIFYNCSNLHYVVFPETCTSAEFGKELFGYVTEPTFYVRGPELDGNGPAGPRRSTWYASTRVSGENGVPYIYTDSSGKECYEVAMKSEDGSLYRYQANQEGQLLSCVLIDEKDYVDIIIPSRIGTIDIKSIGGDCFADVTLRSKIRSITVRDDSISEIGAMAFQNLPKLSKVRIGNSVTSIGENAFANCKVLEDVYFTKPAGGYGALTNMADNAFATEGAKLTFHGDIVEGFKPFDWAMNPDRLLKNEDDKNAPEVNVCYQSLWDSEYGTHLTVMVDRETNEEGKHDVVLLDYPKLSDLLETDSLQNDDELKDYCSDMEQFYYYNVYDNGATTIKSKDNKSVDQLRSEYAAIWNNSGVSESDSRLTAIDGPWINPTFCENWKSYLPKVSGGNASIKENSIYRMLFEPLVAEAAADKNPRPYFERNPYSFVENYLNMQKEDVDPNALEDYQTVPVRAQRFINGTECIIVPAGVTSIDARKYSGGANSDNYDTYMKGSDGDERIRNGEVPGLFSGKYKDYEHDHPTADDGREEDVNGNDLVKYVELSTVRYLPDYAFYNCEQLTDVKLGALQEVGKLPFKDCKNLIHLEGSEDCPAENGLIFQRSAGEDGENVYKLVECLLTKGNASTQVEGLMDGNVNSGTSSVMNSVTEIAENAFEGCKNVLTADLSGMTQLQEIPTDCFKDCTMLMEASLPVSVHKVKEGAFSGKEQNYPLKVTVRGREMDIADKAFDPKNNVTIRSYKDSAAERYAVRYSKEGMRFEEIGSFRVMFFDYDGKQVGLTQELTRRDNEEIYAKAPAEAEELYTEGHRPGFKFTGEWAAYAADGTRRTLDQPITEDLTTFVAQYESDGTMVGGKFVVEFFDGVDGSQLAGRGSSMEDGKYYVEAGKSFADMGWPEPIHPNHVGYEAYGFSSGNGSEGQWTADTKVTENLSVVALYKATATGTTSGGSTNTSGGTTTTSGSTTSSSSKTSSSSSSSSSSSTSSSSTSSSSTTSGPGMYTVFVEGGSGSGSYAPGTAVIVSAYTPAAGMRFEKWTTDSNGVTLASVSMPATTFTMPSNNVTIKANYVETDVTAPKAATVSTGGTGTTDEDDGNTRVDIEKPGISNRDLATANVNGSTDNFVVKISETDEATKAVAAALTNKYGTLDNILYYAMDISLYDSTGTTKISDTTGLSVDITIPIPDSLVAYGGNNMAGAVINGNQLESLNENFTTINGVPCVRFRATHFSPYTIYVDTGNLVEGTLDTTPKTGDPIHPKWFLSLGLACLSIILFLKRDKKTAVKVKAKS